MLWGAYTFADGIYSLWAGIVGKAASTVRRWWVVITGVPGIAAGIIAFFAPAPTAGFLLIFIAICAIIIGVRPSSAPSNLMFTRAASAALAVVWMIATFSVVFGIAMIVLAFKLKGYKNRA